MLVFIFQPKSLSRNLFFIAYIFPKNICMEGMKIECRIHNYVTKSIFYYTVLIFLTFPQILIIYNINYRYLNINPIKLISLKQTLIQINYCPIQQVILLWRSDSSCLPGWFSDSSLKSVTLCQIPSSGSSYRSILYSILSYTKILSIR